jgi:NADP-dependent 3-hydroxy acid dehydrogenase YdfG
MAALKPGLLGGVAYGAAKAASLNMMQGLTAELRDHGIRACTIIPSEVDTPILDNRPLPPDQAARDTLMQPEDVAQAIMLCARMPSRTLVEQIVLSPARSRDMSAELTVAAAPPGSSP